MKWNNPNSDYEYLIDRDPEIETHILNIRENDVFPVDDASSIRVIETPGHLGDHLCFLLSTISEPGHEEPTYLFTGDHILGSQTVSSYG